MRYYIDHEHRAYLPIFRGLVRPEFIAEGGLVVQIPVKNNEVSQQQLRAEILKLSQEQGNEYLRALVERKDIDWQQIVLTQKDWDYKQQGLTPAGAAILAIAITIATSGAGSAITNSVSGSLTNTLGASTANAVGAMSSAAFTSLVSQAGIALVNNQGDIKKTLKQLGQKDSIKQLATSVVTAGLLNKIGGTQWASKFSGTGLDDRVIKAMIDSTARAVVETGINGGSLSENLERALKAGLLNAVHGELAENIKVLEESHYLLHKLAHAAAGCAVGAVQKQCEAGAIGAAVGEVASSLLIGDKILLDLSDAEIETMKQQSKLIVGVVAAYAGYDVNHATNSAGTALDNNGFRVASAVGKGAWRAAKQINSRLSANQKITVTDLKQILKDVVKGEFNDTMDSVKTLLNPHSTVFEKSRAILDLVVGIRLSQGRKVDDLLYDYKIISQSITVGKINGRFPINAMYAGKIYPASKLPANIRNKYPHGVPFTAQGFPDFTRYALQDVKITLTGRRDRDFALADDLAGYNAKNPRPAGYVWHHHHETGRIQLIPDDLHDAVRHTGGFARGR